MKKLFVGFVAVMAIALSVAAAAPKDPIFATYEEARQALLKSSLPDVKSAAAHIATAAQAGNQRAIGDRAAALSQASDMKAARTAFAALSDEMIKYRATRTGGEKTAVVYCPMEKKSWVQPAGSVSNPYVAASMRACGEVKDTK